MRNAGIARAWFTRAAEWRYQAAYGEMRDYLQRYGRIRLLEPLLVGDLPPTVAATATRPGTDPAF